MRNKAFLILVLLLFGSLLLGCDPRDLTTAEVTRVVEGVLVTGDVDAIKIDILSPAEGDGAFDVTIDSIDVDLLLNRITVHFTIIDDADANDYTYFSQAKPTSGEGSILTSYLHRTRWVATSTHTIIYEDVAGNGTYQFMIGRYFHYLNIDPGELIFADATAGFTFRIPTWDDRKHLGAGSFGIGDYHDEQWEFVDTVLGRTVTDVRLAFYDPDVAVTSVKVAFYEVGTGRLAATAVQPAGTTRDDAGLCRLANVHIDGLAPGVAYHVYILVSGNDGIDDFVDKTVADGVIETDAFWGTQDSAHGLYAYIVMETKDTDGIRFAVNLVDDGVATLPDLARPAGFVVRVRTETGRLAYELPIAATGRTTYAIPNEYLGIGYRVSVEDTSGAIVLCRSGVPFLEPAAWATVCGSGDDRTVRIGWNANDARITDGYLEISHNGDVLGIFPFSSWGTTGEVELPFPDVPDNYVDFAARFHLVYSAFEGNDNGVYDLYTFPV